MSNRPLIPLLIALGFFLTPVFTSAAHALDDPHWRQANQAINQGIAYLRSTQNTDKDSEDYGSWSPKAGPAITALAVDVMLSRPTITADDPTVQRALDYILQQVNDDGSIHGGILANYNTSICLSALVHVRDDPEIARVVNNSKQFLKGLQWKEGMTTPDGQKITKDHPYYGGVGYGHHGRPDGSNLQVMTQALYDSGVDCQGPTFQRALTYISRLQGVESNQMFGDQIDHDGGFIYATSINKDLVGVPESKANPKLMEALKAGKEVQVSGLRTYGSMTYAQFKTMVYARLDRSDPRVQKVMDWIAHNWTLERNPGMPINEKTLSHKQGLYYYYMVLGRALNAWGATALTLADGSTVDWQNALIEKLTTLQRDDGSWINQADRWMESNPNLVTAYALIALNNAVD